jgi:Uma2 family endonuclease
MPLLIDERYLPATLTTGPMTDEEFVELCAEHEEVCFEMTADGELIVTSPPYNLEARREEELFIQLHTWANADGLGYAGGSNEGFVLPSGARRGPDASWILKSEVAALPPEILERYWRICPDFIVEIKSHSNTLAILRAKMEEWIANGTELAWLIDPERRVVEIYRPGAEVSIVSSPETITADPPVSGFVLDLRPIWDPLGHE